ncbi:MAG TPA: helix-turn-helix domain-containing protein [Mycobacteriales bacterium]|jgi:DNA-binding HxlR family transcriptional regulator|nr:helix-turn-helix domain-containing protein [Mycobacteriales bacterium]
MTRPAADPDAFVAECPARDLLSRLSDKWVSLVLVALTPGSRRFRELHRRIDGVSQKMLTQTLRSLERDGLLTRTLTPTVPPRTDYELTELGRSLLPIVAAIKTWAEAHIDDVAEAREKYETSHAAADRGALV